MSLNLRGSAENRCVSMPELARFLLLRPVIGEPAPAEYTLSLTQHIEDGKVLYNIAFKVLLADEWVLKDQLWVVKGELRNQVAMLHTAVVNELEIRDKRMEYFHREA